MPSDGSITVPTLPDSIMATTSVLTDSSPVCAAAIVFVFPRAYVCHCTLGRSGSNVIEQEASFAIADEMCKEIAGPSTVIKSHSIWNPAWSAA